LAGQQKSYKHCKKRPGNMLSVTFCQAWKFFEKGQQIHLVGLVVNQHNKQSIKKKIKLRVFTLKLELIEALKNQFFFCEFFFISLFKEGGNFFVICINSQMSYFFEKKNLIWVPKIVEFIFPFW